MIIRVVLLIALGGTVWWFQLRLRKVIVENRERSPRYPRVPPALRGKPNGWVVFTAPGSQACRTVEQLIATHHPHDNVVRIDAVSDPDFARRWDVERVPTTLQVDKAGHVTGHFVGVEALRRHVGQTPADSQPLTDPNP
jgi:hypothetical protein